MTTERDGLVERLPAQWRKGAATLREHGEHEKAEWAESYALQLETCIAAAADALSAAQRLVEELRSGVVHQGQEQTPGFRRGMRHAADKLAALLSERSPQQEEKTDADLQRYSRPSGPAEPEASPLLPANAEKDLRVIVAHPFFALAREFNWDDCQLAAAKRLIDVTVILLEERMAADALSERSPRPATNETEKTTADQAQRQSFDTSAK